MRVRRVLAPLARLSLVTAVLVTGVSAAAADQSSSGRDASTPGASATPASAEDVERFLTAQRDELHLPGLAVVVLRDGRPLVATGLGEAAPGGPAVTTDTPFVLGSTSKQFTGLLVQQLILEGRLTLETRVRDVLPWFGNDGDRLSQITVRDLLGHTSGLSTVAGRAQLGWRAGRPPSIEAGVRALSDEDLTSAPAGSFEYSNSNYDVLGAVIESVRKQPYSQALDELVVEPLGLGSTTANLLEPPDALAAGHYAWLGRFTRVTPDPLVPGAVPSSRVISSANDLARVIQAHLGAADSPATLRPALEAAREPVRRVHDYAEYASGLYVRPLWELNAANSNPLQAGLPLCVEHDGETDRSMSYLLACPQLGLGVVALTNVGQGPDTNRWWSFKNDLVHAVLGTPAGTFPSDPVTENATAIFVGVPLALLVIVAAQARSRGRRRAAIAWSVAGLALGAGALWLGYVYAPARADGGPIHVMWSAVPDLAVSTILSTVATVACAALALLMLRRRAPSPVPDSGSD